MIYIFDKNWEICHYNNAALGFFGPMYSTSFLFQKLSLTEKFISNMQSAMETTYCFTGKVQHFQIKIHINLSNDEIYYILYLEELNHEAQLDLQGILSLLVQNYFCGIIVVEKMQVLYFNDKAYLYLPQIKIGLSVQKLNLDQQSALEINSTVLDQDITIIYIQKIELYIPPYLQDSSFGVIILDEQYNIIKNNKYINLNLNITNLNKITNLVAQDESEIFMEYLVNAKDNNKIQANSFHSQEGDPILIQIKTHLSYIVLYIFREAYAIPKKLHTLHEQRLYALGEIISSISHDFNNMITGILGATDVLLNKLNTPEINLDLESYYNSILYIKTNAGKAGNLIKQILSLSKKQKNKPEILDINEIISDYLATIGRILGPNIKVQFNRNVNIPFIAMNSAQFEQIILNLLVNAKDAMNNVGSITVNTDVVQFDKYQIENNQYIPGGTYSEIVISDSGKGISQANLKNIFDPFFTTKEQGTGLGLHIINSIVRQEHGFIRVTSKLNVGTTFKIYLPFYKENAKSAETVKKIEQTTKNANYLIFVEDEESILDAVTTYLKSKKYLIYSTNDPYAAISFAEHNQISLLITDFILPKMDGLNLFQKILSIHPKLRAIFVSGNTIDLPPMDNVVFLEKPFLLEHLDKIIENLSHGNLK